MNYPYHNVEQNGCCPPPAYPVPYPYPQQTGYSMDKKAPAQTTSATTQMTSNENSVENELGSKDNVFAFSDKSIRMNFIRKVYGIVCCQLGVAVAFIALFTFDDNTKKFAISHLELLILAIIVEIVTLIILICCNSVSRKAPTNYVFLGIFTLCSSYIVGFGTTVYKGNDVFYAVVITFVVVVALTLFAFQTKIDFTVYGGVLFVVLIVFILFGLLFKFTNAYHEKSSTLRLIYAMVGVLIFSFYLIYDTQLMVGGDHKYCYSPEDYVFAAINLYLDIINLFIYILRIMGSK